MFPPASRNAKKYYDKKAKGSDKPEAKAKAAPDAKRKASARKPKAWVWAIHALRGSRGASQVPIIANYII